MATAAHADDDQLPTALGPAPARGRLRATPEDFRVDEQLGFEADGNGGHVLLRVEKRGANTGWVASRLARDAGVAVRDVGWSGQKDRNAVTLQSFSLPWPPAAPLVPCRGFAGDGYRVLAADRHGRKLRPGSHRANRFELVVRELAADRDELLQRLEQIGMHGVPDYFGPQRFGRGGSNLRRAQEWAGSGAAPRDRHDRSFALSAARSEVFNRVLAARVTRGDWNRLLPGEAVMLDGRRSFFRADSVDEVLAARCEAMDVHPSGPLVGCGASPATGEALAAEQDAMTGRESLCSLLVEQGLEHQRRSLRLPVRELSWRIDDDALALAFTLPRGAFATAVLHEILADAWQLADGPED